MEKPQDEQSELLDKAFMIPEADFVEAGLETLTRVWPTARNRLFPSLLNLAGRATTGQDLTIKLLELASDYADTTKHPNGTLAKIAREDLPGYLKILIPEGSLLQATTNSLHDFLKSAKARELLAVRSAWYAPAKSDEPGTDYRSGAPKGIKKLMDIPAADRSESQQVDLDRWMRRTGRLAAGHRPRQPSQRELAQKAAETNRKRNQP